MDDRYRVSRVIARGGMCEVLEAFVQGGGGFERRVVLKRLRAQMAEDPGVRDAFIDEARILSRLAHRNVIQVFDFGELDGRPFQVLEYVDGADLGVLCDRARHRGEAVSPEVALHVAGELAEALAHAHEALDPRGQPLGIVHRDITPHNVLVSWDGQVKLIDFGVAFAEGRLDRTLVGKTKGTLQFMAPEQGRGDEVDGRADVFGLGCLLHWALVGRSPLDSQAARLQAYAGESPSLDEALPVDVATVVRRATRARRSQRYESAREMAEACASARRGRSRGEGPAQLSAWARRFGGLAGEAPAAPHAVGDLFDVALLAQADDTGKEDAPLRRFATVAPEATAENAISGTVPVPVGLDDPQTKLTTDRALAPGASLDAATAILASAAPGDQTLTDEDPPLGLALGDRVYGYALGAEIEAGAGARRFEATHEVRPGAFLIEAFEPEVLGRDQVGPLAEDARAIAARAHPNLAPVLEVGASGAGEVFVAWAGADHGTLAHLVARDAPLPPEKAARLGQQIAEGLAAAHARGLVHGGLDPTRIRLGPPPDATLQIFGFGLHRALRDGGASAPAAELALGAQSYLAPEVAAGGSVDARADLFSLGAVLYALLSGAPPGAGARAARRAKDGFAPLPELGGIQALVHRLLSRAPGDRPDTAAAVASKLHRFADGGEATAIEPAEPDARPAVLEAASAGAPPAAIEPPPPSLLPDVTPRRWSGPVMGTLGFLLVLGAAWLVRAMLFEVEAPVQIPTAPERAAGADAGAAAPGLGLDDVRRRLAQGLRLRELMPDDLRGVPAVEALHRACTEALTRGAVEPASRACAEVVARLDEVPITERILLRTLEGVRAALETRGSALAAPRRAELEARCATLAAQIEAQPPAAERRGLLRALQELRVDIRRG